ncbi:MAG: homoserine dehydrogenase, partial [Alphaproteobacteria bacterium]
MSQTLKIAVAGLGTVGAGVVRLLSEHADILALRGGRGLAVTCVSARERKRKRDVDLSGMQWYEDAVDMAANAEVEVVVELIGGADGVAKDVCEAALGAGRHVVTANKALLAHHGTALAAKAE